MSAAVGGSGDSEAMTSLPPSLNDVSVEYLAALLASGIELASPDGLVSMDPEGGYVRIGFMIVLDDGDIVAVPCEDASAMQIAELCRQAEVVKLDGPTGSQWTRLRHLAGWESSILEPVYGVCGSTPRCAHARLP